MKASFLIERFDPGRDTAPYFKEYTVEVDEYSTVLEGLFAISEGVDGSLSFRRSCRSAICGSCAMRINGREGLACNTRVLPLMERQGEVRVQPLRNTAVIKDLIVDMEPFWRKVDSVRPWVQPGPGLPSGEMRMPRDGFHNVDACIMCSSCTSACTTLEVSGGFTGPSALAKVYRIVADLREGRAGERLSEICREGGVWDCARCNYCVEVCPKDVRPMEAIVRLRRASLGAGYTDSSGARHITAVLDTVKREGRVNEARMPLKVLKGDIAGLLRVIPMGIRMFLKGKVPSILSRPIDGIKEVRRLFDERGW